jgi:tRNA modification GTPase
VLELQGHGGIVVLDLLVARLLQLGCRAARPGEFSERAFLNGKIDLAQAEAVADLIDAGTSAAARAAVRSMQGEFSLRVHALQAQLTGAARLRRGRDRFSGRGDRFLSDRRKAAGSRKFSTRSMRCSPRHGKARCCAKGSTS